MLGESPAQRVECLPVVDDLHAEWMRENGRDPAVRERKIDPFEDARTPLCRMERRRVTQRLRRLVSWQRFSW